MESTKLSSKGQVVLPNSIRTARKWRPGMRLAVENRPEGVLLRPLTPFPQTRLDEVIGSAGYRGRRRTQRQMEDAIVREARRRK